MSRILSPHAPHLEAGDPTAFYLFQRTLEDLALAQGLPATAFLPPRVAAQVEFVRDGREAGDLAYRYGGRAKRPRYEVLLVAPDGKTPIIVSGLGVTEAAELEETAQQAFEEWKPFDFDAAREREGLPSRAQAGEMIREAIWERHQRHRRAPVTDPAPQRSASLVRGYQSGASLPKETP